MLRLVTESLPTQTPTGEAGVTVPPPPLPMVELQLTRVSAAQVAAAQRSAAPGVTRSARMLIPLGGCSGRIITGTGPGCVISRKRLLKGRRGVRPVARHVTSGVQCALSAGRGGAYATGGTQISRGSRGGRPGQGGRTVRAAGLGPLALSRPAAGPRVRRQGGSRLEQRPSHGVRRAGQCRGAPARRGLLPVRLVAQGRYPRVVRLRRRVQLR